MKADNIIIFPIFFFRWESLLVENRLKIKVIVREQGEGILQLSFSVGKEFSVTIIIVLSML